MPVEILTAAILDTDRPPGRDEGPGVRRLPLASWAVLTISLAMALGFGAGRLTVTTGSPDPAGRPTSTPGSRADPGGAPTERLGSGAAPGLAREDWSLQDALQYRGDLSRWTSGHRTSAPAHTREQH